MKQFEKDEIRKALDEMIAIEATGSTNIHNDDYVASKLMTEKIIEEWSFMDLDEFVEGKIEKNDTWLSDDLYPAAVGYALIMRYGISYDDYLEWAEKQNSEFAYILLKLIGIENNSYKIEYDNKNILNQQSRVKSLIEQIKSKKHLILASDNKSEYTLMGKNVAVLNIAKDIAEMNVVIESAYDFSCAVFWNEFETKCKSYKDTSENIAKVFEDAAEAEWVKVKKYLNKLQIEDYKIANIKNDFFDSFDASVIKEELDEVYMQLIESFKEDVSQLEIDDANRKSTQFYGGGIGVGGAIKGMIFANIASGVYGAFANGMTKGAVKRTKANFEKTATNIYLGDNTLSVYKELLKVIADTLKKICIITLYPDAIEDQSEIDDFLSAVNEAINWASPEQIKELVYEVVSVYPCNMNSYKFALKLVSGVRGELELIAEKIGLSDAVASLKSEVINNTNRRIYFGDVEIKETDNCVTLDPIIPLRGYYYKISIPMNTSFLDFENLKYGMDDSMARGGYLLNEKSKMIIRYWSGVESEEDFERQSEQDQEQILNQINSWENMEIQDFRQDIKMSISNDKCTYIVHGQMKFKEFHEVYMLGYVDKHIYMNICVGYLGDMLEEKEKIKDVVESIIIEKQETNYKVPFLTKGEVEKLFREERRIEAEAYFNDRYEELNLPFAVEFRKCFKKMLPLSEYASNGVCKYEYSNDVSAKLFRLMEDEEPIGQYILYNSENIIITDFIVYIRNNDGLFERIYVDYIVEILLVTTCHIEEDTWILVREFDGTNRDIHISKKQIKEVSFLIMMINVIIENLIPGKVRFFKEANRSNQKEVIYCEKCKKISNMRVNESGVLRHISCGNCHAESKYIRKIIKEKRMDSILNALESTGKVDISDEDSIVKKYNVKEYEIQDTTKGDTEELVLLVKEYITKMNGALNYETSVIYRAAFRWILEEFADKNQIIDKYDFCVQSETLLAQTLLKKEDIIGQYILYDENGIIVTDFNVYICTSRGVCIYELTDLIEILPMQEYYGSNFKGIIIHNKKGKFEYIEDSALKQTSYILDLINMVLELVDDYNGKKYERFYYRYRNEKDAAYIYCMSCHKWGVEKIEAGTIFNSKYCSNCRKGTFNAISKCKNDQLETIRMKAFTSFSETFLVNIQKEIERDGKEYGIVDIGIQLHKKYEERQENERKKREEAEKEKLAESDWRYAKFLPQHVKLFREQFLRAIVGTELQRYLIDQDINKLTDNELSKSFEYMRQFQNEQIVLYVCKKVIITDHYIIWGNLVSTIEDLQEIAWFNLESNHAISKVLIKRKYNSEIFACEDEDQNKLISLIINVALTGIRDDDFVTEYDKDVNYCGKCGSRNVVIKGLFKSKCYNCGNSYTGALYKNDWKGVDIEAFKNKIYNANDSQKPEGIKAISTQTETLKDSIIEENKENARMDSGTRETQEHTKMIYCTKCGGKINPSYKFCNYCGQENLYRRGGER